METLGIQAIINNNGVVIIIYTYTVGN